MNKSIAPFWIIIAFLFLLPTSIGRFFIDMVGGIMMIIILLSILIAGASWLSWKKLQSNIKNCNNCGATYFSDINKCPICGSIELNAQNSVENNVPASSATIDISAEETD